MTTTPLWFKLSMATLTAVGLLVAVAMMPLVANERAGRAARADRAEQAARFAAIAADARQVGDLAMAGRALAAAIELEPGDAALRDGLAEVHVEQILAEHALIDEGNAARLQLELSERLLTGGRDARTLTAYAKVLLFRDRPEAARERLREAIELDGELLSAHVFLADALLRAEEWTGAARSAERALSIAPDDGLAHYAMGRAQVGLKDWEAAARHYTRAAEAMDQPMVWRALGAVQARREKWTEAEVAWRRAFERQPDAVEMYADYARALALNGKLGPAATLFEQAWNRRGDVDAYASLGDVALKAGDFERAARIFAEMMRLRPGDPQMTCRLGYAHRGRGAAAEARAAFALCAKQAKGQDGQEALAATAERELAAAGAEGAAE